MTSSKTIHPSPAGLHLSRRSLLGGIALGVMAGSQAQAQTPTTTIRVGTPVGALPGIKTAIEEGFFRDAGIDIKFVTLAGGPNILSATVGGSIDVGYSDLFAWVGALGNGFDLTFLQAANGRGNADYIIAGPKSGIASPKDLRGRKIGIAAHAQSKLRVVLYLKRFGLSGNDVSFVTINNRDTVGAALYSGQLDAAIAADPDVAVWEQEFKVVPLEGRPWQQIPEATATAAFFATRKWIDADPKRAETFVRVARKGATRFNGYSARQKAEIVLKYDKVDLFKLEKEVPGILDRLNDVNAAQDGPVDLEAMAGWFQMAKENGIIKNVIDLTPHLYPTALAARV